MLPEREFSFKYRVSRAPKLPRKSGMVPVMLQTARSRQCKLGIERIQSGMGPCVKLLELRSRIWRLVRLANQEGTGATVKLASPRWISVRFVSLPRLDGNNPDRFAACRFSSCSLGKSPNVSGMGPAKLEQERSRISRFVSCEMLVGNGPSMYVRLRFKLTNLLQSSKSRGKEPARFVFPKFKVVRFFSCPAKASSQKHKPPAPTVSIFVAGALYCECTHLHYQFSSSFCGVLYCECNPSELSFSHVARCIKFLSQFFGDKLYCECTHLCNLKMVFNLEEGYNHC